MKKQTMIMAAALFGAATAKAELVQFSSQFGGLDPWAFVYHGSPYSHKNLHAGPIVPGQPSGTSVTGAFDLGGSYAIDFRDTLNGPVADVTFDLLGTSQTLAGFIVRAPLGRANFYAVTLDEALQGMFTINAPLPPRYQPQTGFRPIDKIAVITCEGVCGPAGELLPDGGATVLLLAATLGALWIAGLCFRTPETLPRQGAGTGSDNRAAKTRLRAEQQKQIEALTATVRKVNERIAPALQIAANKD